MSDEQYGLINQPEQPKTLEQIPGPSALSVFLAAMIELAGAMPLAGGAIKDSLNALCQRGAYDRQKVLDSTHLDYIARQIPLLRERIERLAEQLREQDKELDPADVASILEAAVEASRKTSGEKRRFFLNALQNAFSLELYQEGLNLVFFKKLEELSYGDLLVLNAIAKHEDMIKLERHVGNSGQPLSALMLPQAIESLGAFHLKNLAKVELIAAYSETAYYRTPITLRFCTFINELDDEA